MSTNTETVNHWLNELGKTLKIDLKLDNEGICAVQHKDGLTYIIEVPKDSSLVHIYTNIVPLTGGDAEDHALLEKAMQMNLFNIQTKGGSLGLSPELNEILLCFAEPIDNCDHTLFSNIFINFIDAATEVREEFLKELEGG